MMNPLFANEPSYFVWLLIWRGAMACSALIVVVKRPLDIPVVVLLAMLAMLLAVGEAAYKTKVYLEREKLRKERDKADRERRAEEARLRFEATRELQRKADRKYMNLDLDEVDAPPEAISGTAKALSQKEFEMALTLGEEKRAA